MKNTVAASWKKPIVISTFFWLMLILNQATIANAAQTVVQVEPPESYASMNQTITIDVTIADVENLYGLEVALYWNSSILDVVNIDVRLWQPDGIFYGDPNIVENSSTGGKYLLVATSINPAPSFNGSGNIVQITFNATGSGGTKLDLESQLYDYPPLDREPRISWPIEHTDVDGLVIPEFPNGLILLLFLIVTASAFVFSKKKLHSHQTRFISRRKS